MFVWFTTSSDCKIANCTSFNYYNIIYQIKTMTESLQIKSYFSLRTLHSLQGSFLQRPSYSIQIYYITLSVPLFVQIQNNLLGCICVTIHYLGINLLTVNCEFPPLRRPPIIWMLPLSVVVLRRRAPETLIYCLPYTFINIVLLGRVEVGLPYFKTLINFIFIKKNSTGVP